MTDISKEAVALDLIWLDQLAAEDGVSPAVMLAERYRALSARVEELEAQVDLLEITLNERVSEWAVEKREKAAKRNGRLQGLDEAKARVRTIARECRAYSNHPPSQPEAAEWKAQRMREAYQLSRAENAIQALKEQSND